MEDKRLFFSQNDWNENVAQTFPFISPLCPNDFWACEGVPLKGRQSFYSEAISTSVWFSVPINMLWGPHTVQETNFEEWGRERSEHTKPRGLNHFCPRSGPVRVCQWESEWERERERELKESIVCLCVFKKEPETSKEKKKKLVVSIILRTGALDWKSTKNNRLSSCSIPFNVLVTSVLIKHSFFSVL